MRKIYSIEIVNSPFFADTKITFSDKLNCIMGGRGSGKTTLLYFMRSAIDQNAESSRLLYDVLMNNLGQGTITLEIGEDGETFQITKELNENPQPYTLPKKDYINFNNIEEKISCDFYEANQIEEIGRKSKDRLELIDRKASETVNQLVSKIRSLQIELESNAQEIKTINQRTSQKREVLDEYEDVESQFEELKTENPEGLAETEKLQFQEADKKEKTRLAEKRMVLRVKETLLELEQQSTNLVSRTNSSFTLFKEEINQFDNADLFKEILDNINVIDSQLALQNSKLLSSIRDCRERLASSEATLSDTHDIQQAEFVRLKQKFEKHKEYINKYNSLSKKVAAKKVLLAEIKQLREQQLGKKKIRAVLLKSLNENKSTIFEERLKAVSELNKGFDGQIVITLTFGGIKNEFEEKLRSALVGSNIQYNKLIPRILERFTPEEFANVINNSDLGSLRSIEFIDEKRAEVLVDVLRETEQIYEIETIYCPDLPEFKLRIGENAKLEEDNFRSTEQLSMGQRCTAVLPIIFAVSTDPLVIDQPEDNLDNKYITEKIHELIKGLKTTRQMIFITHNPNIPVLSDAEHNVFLSYEKRRSIVDGSGSVQAVKVKIIRLLEGGKEAFNRRRNIYGDALD